ncbi:GNAT family N-acetyltransferase [Sneathiella sp.]|jgi:putative acetyltransferase|uniref:GNAT family N-acetyltransferase n=1 Tax=Sneathiella sp. TaxID=1964365 RepID=UPI0039E56A64
MIRDLTLNDFGCLKEVFYNSFSEDEAPLTYDVITKIICTKAQPPSLCLGYEEGDKLVGAVAFSPIYFEDNPQMSAYILAPLAVHIVHQKKGIATKLIDKSKEKLSDLGVDVLLVYGDPNYYGRYGFNVELAKQFIPPYPLEYEFGWQAMMLNSKDIKKDIYKFSCVKALSDASLW